MVKIHPHAKFQAITSMGFPENVQKPQIWPVSLSQNSAKMRKINKPQPYSYQFWRFSRYINMQISDHSLHAFFSKLPEISPDGQTDERTDGHATKRLRLVGWTNGPMYRWKEVISGFGWTDRRTDGQTNGQTTENIMPPAPKGGGIKIADFK